MKNHKIILWLIVSLINSVIIYAQNPIGLKPSASGRGLILGAAVGIRYLRSNVDDGRYRSYFDRNFQMIVPGSELMPMQIWKGENQYNFNDSDWLLGETLNSTGWAQQNYFQVRGHTLIWAYDSRIPRWLLDQETSISSEKAKSLLKDYIYTVVGRYRGKIQWWDVVNEAISDYNETRPFNLRTSFWYRKLGTDFIKYAFDFAHDADPSAKLFYNEYKIENGGLKAERTLTFIKWLKSEKIPIYGLGMQWHINTTKVIIPGDEHYQIAQRFIDQNISLTISELDVAIETNGGYPIDPNAIQKQANIYHSLLKYVLYFFPKIPAMITWGYTDRFSWIPLATNYTKGDGLTLDCQYQPKAAYWKLQEELARILTNGIYRLSPQSQSNKCLISSYDNGTVQIDIGNCNNTNQKWNITWLGDGTYRLSPQNIANYALNAYNATASIGTVQINNWTGDFNQEWSITVQGNNTYGIAPRNAWWRIFTVYETSNIGIVNRIYGGLQNWILTIV
ncbi:hypothetical protein I4U23_022009 [Adineta vaga]|nr:hypothetical protein I4U23_022009 [Adineta vaga]